MSTEICKRPPLPSGRPLQAAWSEPRRSEREPSSVVAPCKVSHSDATMTPKWCQLDSSRWTSAPSIPAELFGRWRPFSEVYLALKGETTAHKDDKSHALPISRLVCTLCLPKGLLPDACSCSSPYVCCQILHCSGPCWKALPCLLWCPVALASVSAYAATWTRLRTMAKATPAFFWPGRGTYLGTYLRSVVKHAYV